jgi:hypothetical protein
MDMLNEALRMAILHDWGDDMLLKDFRDLQNEKVLEFMKNEGIGIGTSAASSPCGGRPVLPGQGRPLNAVRPKATRVLSSGSASCRRRGGAGLVYRERGGAGKWPEQRKQLTDFLPANASQKKLLIFTPSTHCFNRTPPASRAGRAEARQGLAR